MFRIRLNFVSLSFYRSHSVILLARDSMQSALNAIARPSVRHTGVCSPTPL